MSSLPQLSASEVLGALAANVRFLKPGRLGGIIERVKKNRASGVRQDTALHTAILAEKIYDAAITTDKRLATSATVEASFHYYQASTTIADKDLAAKLRAKAGTMANKASLTGAPLQPEEAQCIQEVLDGLNKRPATDAGEQRAQEALDTFDALS